MDGIHANVGEVQEAVNIFKERAEARLKVYLWGKMSRYWLG